MINNFSLAFLTALSLTIVLRLYLAYRQISYVLARRCKVPKQFSERVELSAHQKAADYTAQRTRFGILTLAVETGLLLAFTFGGGLQALHDFWSVRLSGLAYGIAMIFSVMFVSGLVDLPLSVYSQFVIEEKFGFNRMTLKLFIADLLKQTALGIAIGTPVLVAVLWLMAQRGSFWWLYVWLFWCVFNLLILFIYPTWIAPLFNKFTPLDDAPLKARIEALLQRCGFATSGLFVMDGSRRSNHGNAYFTGFGKTKRIVFFDTLLGRLQPVEMEAVLAHELGHFRHRHVIKRIVLIFALSLAFLAALGQLIDADWFFSGLGVSAKDTVLALILFFMVTPVFTFLLTPLTSLISRRHEFEADRYAAEHASADGLIEALVKLYEDNAATLTPDPLHSLFYDSHPPASLRIARLNGC
ncbi:Ste24 endopeptidase [Candidatus Propionivibrio aalborgensis]|uniref:Ste24 endopeptidase n=1 Tax=Candidatus Propionivibrio aalborgensis TaxID=1860101 RepID=A0A1A8Y0W0_9RHOO|nr:M48 family metallopeptidase [Candidatus Propionivibrio aalborgensis]MBK7325033.1 M48 family metallopeptidase [Propionivibrio sp.]MBK9028626.1 M48 family metallopeptidase [Propionivibrio sp.]SBT10591.1 Ste24 endopeptidase [Candidatus Propionivibrio aalborgensis]HRC61009.1 M48 family metallopeptidase [Candidatus Propionivibrio aalborgensis]